MPASSELKARTQELFCALKTQNRKASWVRVRNQIAMLNCGLAEKLANRYSEDGREAFEDLYQVGMIGLLKAVGAYDPARGTAFSSYAVLYIRGEILHHRRDRTRAIKIPRQWGDRFSQLRQLLDEGASYETMAARTRIPLGQIQLAIDAMLRPDALSLDAPLGPDGDDAWEIPYLDPEPEEEGQEAGVLETGQPAG